MQERLSWVACSEVVLCFDKFIWVVNVQNTNFMKHFVHCSTFKLNLHLIQLQSFLTQIYFFTSNLLKTFLLLFPDLSQKCFVHAKILRFLSIDSSGFFFRIKSHKRSEKTISSYHDKTPSEILQQNWDFFILYARKHFARFNGKNILKMSQELNENLQRLCRLFCRSYARIFWAWLHEQRQKLGGNLRK